MMSTKIGTTTLKSSSRFPLNKKRICKREEIRSSSSKCMQSIQWQERVLFWEIQTILFFKFARSSRGGENPLFARYACVIKQLSTTKTTHRTSFCALRSQHLLWQMCPSLSLFTTDYPSLSGRWNGIAFPYPSHFLPLYLPTKHRETTERSPRDERLKIAVNFD